jgi:hypothetical protein
MSFSPRCYYCRRVILSSRYTVALRFECLPGLDEAACRAPLLFDRARSSETEAVDFVSVATFRVEPYGARS